MLVSTQGTYITLVEPKMQKNKSDCAADCIGSFDCVCSVAVGELQGLVGDQAQAAGQAGGPSGCGSDIAGDQDPGGGPQEALQQAEKQEEASTSTSPRSQHECRQHDGRGRRAPC